MNISIFYNVYTEPPKIESSPIKTLNLSILDSQNVLCEFLHCKIQVILIETAHVSQNYIFLSMFSQYTNDQQKSNAPQLNISLQRIIKLCNILQIKLFNRNCNIRNYKHPLHNSN